MFEKHCHRFELIVWVIYHIIFGAFNAYSMYLTLQL